MMSINGAYSPKSSKKCGSGAFWFFLLGLVLGVFFGQSSHYRHYYNEFTAFIISHTGGKDSALAKWLISKHPAEKADTEHTPAVGLQPTKTAAPAPVSAKPSEDHRVSEPLPMLDLSPPPATPSAPATAPKP